MRIVPKNTPTDDQSIGVLVYPEVRSDFGAMLPIGNMKVATVASIERFLKEKEKDIEVAFRMMVNEKPSLFPRDNPFETFLSCYKGTAALAMILIVENYQVTKRHTVKLPRDQFLSLDHQYLHCVDNEGNEICIDPTYKQFLVPFETRGDLAELPNILIKKRSDLIQFIQEVTELLFKGIDEKGKISLYHPSGNRFLTLSKEEVPKYLMQIWGLSDFSVDYVYSSVVFGNEIKDVFCGQSQREEESLAFKMLELTGLLEVWK